MRLITKLLLFACSAWAVAGCTKEDNSRCIVENVTLLFKYNDPAGGGADVLLRDIHSVNAFIFDADKKFVEQRRFEQQELAVFAGWKLKLPAGDYYAVCWGNADSHSAFNAFTPGLTTLDQCRVQIGAGATDNGDPIYYAPYLLPPQSRCDASATRAIDPSATRAIDPSMTSYAFTAIERQRVVKEMYFSIAHLTINVYIMGYAESALPTVSGTQLGAGYDFLYNPTGRYTNLTQVARPVTTADGPALLVTFYVSFYDITDDINFTLRSGNTGMNLETVNLQQFLADYPAARHGEVIDILIKFSDFGVTITLPGWDNKPITPN